MTYKDLLERCYLEKREKKLEDYYDNPVEFGRELAKICVEKAFDEVFNKNRKGGKILEEKVALSKEVMSQRVSDLNSLLIDIRELSFSLEDKLFGVHSADAEAVKDCNSINDRLREIDETARITHDVLYSLMERL